MVPTIGHCQPTPKMDNEEGHAEHQQPEGDRAGGAVDASVIYVVQGASKNRYRGANEESAAEQRRDEAKSLACGHRVSNRRAPAKSGWLRPRSSTELADWAAAIRVGRRHSELANVLN
jgi:hypothetical protein